MATAPAPKIEGDADARKFFDLILGVLFVDVRGFTSLAEDLAPTGVAGLLKGWEDRQGAASAGQIVLSERLFDRLSEAPAGTARTSLTLKGKREPEPARVVQLEMART